VLLPGWLIFQFPERFWNWPFWHFKENLHTALKLGIALELTWRTSRAFPGWRPYRWTRRISCCSLLSCRLAP
jgi:hypothetical protein